MTVFWCERRCPDVVPGTLLAGGSRPDRGGTLGDAKLPSRVGRPGPARAAGRERYADRVHRAWLLWPGRRTRSTRNTGTVHGNGDDASRAQAGRSAGRAPLHPLDEGRRGARCQHRLRGRRSTWWRRGDRQAARHICLELYTRAAARAADVGFILADTKFELGYVDGVLSLCDEVVTPDSSRLWPADQVIPGHTPPAFDKQLIARLVDRRSRAMGSHAHLRRRCRGTSREALSAALCGRLRAGHRLSLDDWYGAKS